MKVHDDNSHREVAIFDRALWEYEKAGQMVWSAEEGKVNTLRATGCRLTTGQLR
jgi:hypothetical protein